MKFPIMTTQIGEGGVGGLGVEEGGEALINKLYLIGYAPIISNKYLMLFL